MDSATLLTAADSVENLATHLKRSREVYEQGIGCERAAQMLRKMAALNNGTSQDVPPEIILAAEKVHNWFEMQGCHAWALGKIQSRP